MIIKTITCHDVYNHGASLQAFALQNYLEKEGHSVQIIDYKPSYLSRHHLLWIVTNPFWDNNFILRCVYLLIKLPGRLLALIRKRKFDNFTEKYLKLTTDRYGCNEELKKDCPTADVYIAGSDQIWNTKFPNGKDPAFYLDFAPKTKRRISYAASFATKNIVHGYEGFVKNQIQSLDYISVRETDGLNILKALNINRGVHVCDPVFLLKKDDWSNLLTKSYKEKYLVCYDFENNSIIKKVAQTVARITGWKIYMISNSRSSYADENFSYSGPETFVSLISQAQLVISNSFHGTAFSIIFERNFFVIKRTDGLNQRMISFLDNLNLSNRLLGDDFSEDNLLGAISYVPVNSIIESFVENSTRFLNENLNYDT